MGSVSPDHKKPDKNHGSQPRAVVFSFNSKEQKSGETLWVSRRKARNTEMVKITSKPPQTQWVCTMVPRRF